MKRISILLFSFLTLTGVSACKKPQFYLEGSWFFKEVKERTSTFSRTDITSSHRNYELQFYPGGVLVQRDLSNSDSLLGNWQLNKTTVSTGEGSATVQQLILSFPSATNIFEQITVLNNVSVNKTYLRGSTNDHRGNQYREYVLQRR